MYVLSRFLNVDGVGAVRMSRGKLFHAVGPATENAQLPSWCLVRGTRRSLRTVEQRAERVATVVTGTHNYFIYDKQARLITFRVTNAYAYNLRDLVTTRTAERFLGYCQSHRVAL